MDCLIALPDEYFEVLDSYKKPSSDLKEVHSEERVIMHGNRNNLLTSIGGFLRKKGFGELEILTLLRDINTRSCNPSLSDSEVDRIAKSTSRYKAEETNSDNKAWEFENWTLQDFMAVESFKEPIPVVSGLFNLSEFHIISAPAKAGKSILVMGLALSISSGSLFLDRFEVQQMKVLYLQTEIGNFQLRQRLEKAIPEELTNFGQNLLIANKRLRLDKKEGLQILSDFIDQKEIKVLILDPFYTLHSSNEDSSSEMAPLLSDLRSLALAKGCLIILVHHQGKRGEQDTQTGHKHRGSSSFADVPDGNLSLRRTSKESAVLDFEMRNIESPDSLDLILKGLSWTFVGTIAKREELTSFHIEEILKTSPDLSHSNLVEKICSIHGVSKRSAQEKISLTVKRGLILKKRSGREVLYYVNPIEIDTNALAQSPKGGSTAHNIQESL